MKNNINLKPVLRSRLLSYLNLNEVTINPNGEIVGYDCNMLFRKWDKTTSRYILKKIIFF